MSSVLLVNINRILAHLAAKSAREEPSPLPVKALVLSAPRVNTLLLDLELVRLALLDTTQTSLAADLAQHVRLGPNAQELAAPPPLSVLLAISSPSLLKPRVLSALPEPILLKLDLVRVLHALVPPLLVLQVALNGVCVSLRAVFKIILFYK